METVSTIVPIYKDNLDKFAEEMAKLGLGLRVTFSSNELPLPKHQNRETVDIAYVLPKDIILRAAYLQNVSSFCLIGPYTGQC